VKSPAAPAIVSTPDQRISHMIQIISADVNDNDHLYKSNIFVSLALTLNSTGYFTIFAPQSQRHHYSRK